MTSSSIAALFGTMLLLSLTPGPSDFAVVSRSLSSGFGSALHMVMGIIAADLVFIALAMFGLAALTETLGPAFILAQWLAAAFLIGMGWQSWRTQPGEPLTPMQAARSSNFTTGLLLTFADPKAIVFYMGLLPAFIDMEKLTLSDAGIVAVLATIVIAGVKLGYAGMAIRAGALFTDYKARRRLNRMAGIVLIGTGCFLVLRSFAGNLL